MIRRVVEYMITCDAKQKCVVDDFGYTLAFGSPTMKDCEDQARQSGWHQLSARLWLCPDCVKKTEQVAKHPATSTDGEG